MKNMILKTCFLFALVAVFALGITVVSEPAHALSKCPALECGVDHTGWVDAEYDCIQKHEGCILQCDVWRNTSNNQLCFDDCNWQ